MPKELRAVLDEAVKIVNLIKSCAMNARLFFILRNEMGIHFQQLLLHSKVQWLSQGKVLTRLCDLHKEVLLFLTEIDSPLAKHIEDMNWVAIPSAVSHLHRPPVDPQQSALSIDLLPDLQQSAISTDLLLTLSSQLYPSISCQIFSSRPPSSTFCQTHSWAIPADAQPDLQLPALGPAPRPPSSPAHIVNLQSGSAHLSYHLVDLQSGSAHLSCRLVNLQSSPAYVAGLLSSPAYTASLLSRSAYIVDLQIIVQSGLAHLVALLPILQSGSACLVILLSFLQSFSSYIISIQNIVQSCPGL
eukprot:superscaffoldBa00000450_g4822